MVFCLPYPRVINQNVIFYLIILKIIVVVAVTRGTGYWYVMIAEALMKKTEILGDRGQL